MQTYFLLDEDNYTTNLFQMLSLAGNKFFAFETQILQVS